MVERLNERDKMRSHSAAFPIAIGTSTLTLTGFGERSRKRLVRSWRSFRRHRSFSRKWLLPMIRISSGTIWGHCSICGWCDPWVSACSILAGLKQRGRGAPLRPCLGQIGRRTPGHPRRIRRGPGLGAQGRCFRPSSSPRLAQDRCADVSTQLIASIVPVPTLQNPPASPSSGAPPASNDDETLERAIVHVVGVDAVDVVTVLAEPLPANARASLVIISRWIVVLRAERRAGVPP